MTDHNTAAVAPQNLPPDAQLLQLVCACFVSQAVYAAAKLGIADLVKDGPKDAEYLSQQTVMDELSLYRVLRTLVSVGVFTETDGKTFANSPMSEFLRSDHPNSARDLSIWMGEPEHWKVYGDMLYSVKTGKPAWDHVHGEPVFPYLFKTNTALGDIFNRAMTSLSHHSIPGLLKAYDFSGVETIADIAGGVGHLLGAVLQKYPSMNGVLFDMSEVLSSAPSMLDSYGVNDRVELVDGDFFTSIPVKADVYILKHIIHDWYDDNCEKILRNIHSVMPDDGRILIIDAVIPDGDGPHYGKVLDLEMMISPGGCERTETEFADLLNKSGLKLNRIIPTEGPMCIVEAVKA